MENNAMQQAQRAIVEALGFRKEHTGGGCMTYARHFAGGVHVMVTNADADLPDGTDWYVGVYDKDGEHLGAHWYGEPLDEYVAAINEAIAFAEKSIPSTDTLADEYRAWLNDNGLPDVCADELDLRLAMWQRWLTDFRARWEAVQEHEDFQQDCAARGA